MSENASEMAGRHLHSLSSGSLRFTGRARHWAMSTYVPLVAGSTAVWTPGNIRLGTPPTIVAEPVKQPPRSGQLVAPSGWSGCPRKAHLTRSLVTKCAHPILSCGRSRYCMNRWTNPVRGSRNGPFGLNTHTEREPDQSRSSSSAPVRHRCQHSCCYYAQPLASGSSSYLLVDMTGGRPHVIDREDGRLATGGGDCAAAAADHHRGCHRRRRLGE